MDWNTPIEGNLTLGWLVIGILIFAAFIALCVIVGKKNRISAGNRMAQICPSLEPGGIDVSLLEGEPIFLNKLYEKLEDIQSLATGVCDVKKANIDYLFNYYRQGRRDVDDYLQCVVIGSNTDDMVVKSKPKGIYTTSQRKRTELKRKKKGNAQDIYWKGDDALVCTLSSDTALKNRLLDYLQTGNNLAKMRIYHEDPYRGYVIIENDFFIPNVEEFQIMDIIAGHVKTAWFGY